MDIIKRDVKDMDTKCKQAKELATVSLSQSRIDVNVWPNASTRMQIELRSKVKYFRFSFHFSFAFSGRSMGYNQCH